MGRSVRKKCPLQELLVQAARMRRKKLMKSAYPLALQSLHLGPNCGTLQGKKCGSGRLGQTEIFGPTILKGPLQARQISRLMLATAGQ